MRIKMLLKVDTSTIIRLSLSMCRISSESSLSLETHVYNHYCVALLVSLTSFSIYCPSKLFCPSILLHCSAPMWNRHKRADLTLVVPRTAPQRCCAICTAHPALLVKTPLYSYAQTINTYKEQIFELYVYNMFVKYSVQSDSLWFNNAI